MRGAAAGPAEGSASFCSGISNFETSSQKLEHLPPKKKSSIYEFVPPPNPLLPKRFTVTEPLKSGF